MSEGSPKPPEGMTKLEYILLAEELSQHAEGFPFPGISREARDKIKAGEEEDPDYATPVDILLERFRRHGMKVVLGKNPESGNVFILPCDSDNIEHDSLSPRHLDAHDGMDPKLIQLITASKKPRPKGRIELPAEHKIKPSFRKDDIILPN